MYINRSEKLGKNIQAVIYNGVRTVLNSILQTEELQKSSADRWGVCIKL